MTAAVVVPLDTETYVERGERGAAWHHVHVALEHEDFAVYAGLVPPGAWVKADAVRGGVALTDADVLVIHDADVVIAPFILRAAILAVEHGEAWAVPHGPVHRFDKRSTEAMYVGDHAHQPTLTRWAYMGIPGGGIVVLRRDVYEACPLDRRFVGWGGEDQAWGWALATLFGAPWRSDVQLVHLWHPHATGHTNPQRPPRLESERLRRSYRAARGDAERMRALVNSGR